ncbi:hypothetical protein AB8880_09570 [Alphaproteobacteria bacterium LSUCC0684]
MPKTETGIREGCVILPFARPEFPSQNVKATTLAALVAITIIHDADISPEDRLIEIIESTGEAEVLDSEDTLVDLGLDDLDDEGNARLPDPVNDNTAVTIIT